MKVKKYIVDSLPQAMGQIKTDLGQDAMILHTKTIKTGGFLGLFRKERIEVIAAIDNVPAKPVQAPPPSYPVKPMVPVDSSTYSPIYSRPVQQSVNPDSDRLTKVSDNRQMVEKSSEISSEVKEIKQMLVKMMIKQSDSDSQASYQNEVKVIYERLLKQGVKEVIASEIVAEVLYITGDRLENLDIWQIAKIVIVQRLQVNGTASKEINPATQIVHFVGATGVGRTTTVAKLAADKVLRQKKRIAFITADTYRIGAVDQLRTYAEILHSPIEVVFSPQDTQKSIDKLKNFDLIFMDTAGRNYNNEMYISELNNILAKSNHSETFLVVSLTHKFDDMVSILEKFAKVNINKILFTKFDETFSYGAILNILSNFPYKPSYVTHGQNVPDDIEVFDEEKIARAILGV